MAQIREIKKRMVAVGTIARITKTMQMIATAKFNAALGRAKASRPYTDTIRALVGEVSAAAGDVRSPLFESPATSPKRTAIVLVTSDRGLCGAFNGHVTRATIKLMKPLREAGHEFMLAVQGKKGMGFCKFQKIPVAMPLNFGDKVKFEDVDALATRLMEEFVAGKYDSVQVVYMRFVSAAKQEPEVMQLLPLKAVAPAGGAAASACEFLPSAERILADLLPRSVKVSLYQAFLDAAVSEQAMRRVAMKSATDNARGLGRVLKRNYNRARQAKITTELTEIVTGAAALE
jgi:F-type H+-transporting ATPase subunit gamma